MNPAFVVFYLPPAAEHALACSLGLIEYPDRRVYRDIITACVADQERQGCLVKILKCRPWRVVKALSDLGFVNNSPNRSTAYVYLVQENDAATDDFDDH